MEDESRAEQNSVPPEPPTIPTSLPGHGDRLTHISPSPREQLCVWWWLVTGRGRAGRRRSVVTSASKARGASAVRRGGQPPDTPGAQAGVSGHKQHAPSHRPTALGQPAPARPGQGPSGGPSPCAPSRQAAGLRPPCSLHPRSSARPPFSRHHLFREAFQTLPRQECSPSPGPWTLCHPEPVTCQLSVSLPGGAVGTQGQTPAALS